LKVQKSRKPWARNFKRTKRKVQYYWPVSSLVWLWHLLFRVGSPAGQYLSVVFYEYETKKWKSC